MSLFDAGFCENRCPLCKLARKGNRLALFIHKIEHAVTFGGCPACRARKKKYGVEPDQNLPAE